MASNSASGSSNPSSPASPCSHSSGTAGTGAIPGVAALLFKMELETQRRAEQRERDAERLAELFPTRSADGGGVAPLDHVANATSDVSDDTIRAKEDAAAATLAGHNRHSISTQASDPRFAPRLQHLRTCLRDQPAGRASPTRAAAACCTPDGCAPTPPSPVTGPAPASPLAVTPTPVEREAKVKARKAQRAASGCSSRNNPPQAYRGPNEPRLAVNTAAFATLKAAQGCFGCDVHGQLVPSQSHWECKLYGAEASAFSRGSRVVPAREGAGPCPVSLPVPQSHLGQGMGFGRRQA